MILNELLISKIKSPMKLRKIFPPWEEGPCRLKHPQTFELNIVFQRNLLEGAFLKETLSSTIQQTYGHYMVLWCAVATIAQATKQCSCWVKHVPRRGFTLMQIRVICECSALGWQADSHSHSTNILHILRAFHMNHIIHTTHIASISIHFECIIYA